MYGLLVVPDALSSPRILIYPTPFGIIFTLSANTDVPKLEAIIAPIANVATTFFNFYLNS